MASRKTEKGVRKKDQVPRRLFKQRGRPPAGSGLVGKMPKIPPGTKVVIAPPGQEKMSEVLEDFVKPYLKIAHFSETALRKLYGMGMLAWNAALMPEAKRQEMIAKFMQLSLSETSETDRMAFLEMLKTLIQRKERFFAANRRAILSFAITVVGPEDYHINVASTLPEE